MEEGGVGFVFGGAFGGEGESPVSMAMVVALDWTVWVGGYLTDMFLLSMSAITDTSS